MTYVTDNFVRANGALGSNWAAVIPNTAESMFNALTGDVQILNNGYGPIAAGGGDACSLWNGGQTFGNDQYAAATVKTIAGYTAVLSITAATQSGGNTTYTYTVTSGSVTDPISGGALYVLITGMTNAGNNGHFVATTFGAGTFTVANASGVTESGSTGTGKCPSDSGAGVMVRGSGTSKANLNGYFFHVGTNSFGGGGRQAYYELWKVVNGVGTALALSLDTGRGLILPAVGDVFGISAVGTTITAYYNGIVLYTVTDAAIGSGIPGITSWSMNGPIEYQFQSPSEPNWNDVVNPPGNNGTTLNNFAAGDISALRTQLASDSFTEGQSQTQSLSDSFVYANGDLHTDNPNWVYQTGSFQISANKCFPSANPCLAYRSDVVWPADQYSRVTAVVAVAAATQNCGPAVRVSTSATTGYVVQYATNLLRISKYVAGVNTTLATSTVNPITGDVVELIAIGSQIVCLLNGHMACSAVDTSIASGNAGLFGAANATSNGFSAWDGGSVLSLGIPSNYVSLPNQQYISDTTFGAYALAIDGLNQAQLVESRVNWPLDQYSEVIITETTDPQFVGPCVRQSLNASTGYSFFPSLGNLFLYKESAGVYTQLAAITRAYVANQTYRLEVQGAMLVGKINGTTILTTFDTTIASGNPGLNTSQIKGSVTGSVVGTAKSFAAGVVGPIASGSSHAPSHMTQISGVLHQLQQL